MIKKPLQWALNPLQIQPSWQWFYTNNVWLWPLWENTGLVANDLGNGAYPGTISGAGTAWIDDPTIGISVQLTAASHGYIIAPPNSGIAHIGNDDSFTAFFLLRPSGDQGANAVADYDAGAANISTLLYNAIGGYYGWNIYQPGSSPLAGTNTLIGTVPTGQPVDVLIMTWDRSIPANHVVSFWLNGAPLSAVHPSFNVGPIEMNDVAGLQLAIGRDGAFSGDYWDGIVAMAGLQDRVWNNTEITDFSADPFQVLVQAAPVTPSLHRIVTGGTIKVGGEIRIR